MIDPWKEKTLQTILSNYQTTEIYNAEEFGKFYKALPKKTLHLKDERCTGGKHSKIRLTGLAAANMNGGKLLMFVIRKLNNPPCFKHVKILPWMDSQLFEELEREPDDQFDKENRKFALIIDYCTAHPEIEWLKTINLFFLPPNTTYALQLKE